MCDAPLVVRLSAFDTADRGPSEVGGKASAIARLIAAGHPVPRSAVVTTAAYRAAAAMQEVDSLVARVRGGHADRIDDSEIDRAFLAVPVPAEVRAALRALASAFDGPVAVRSSATSEDQSSSAFAGQYRSLLGVAPAELDRAVRLVWASLWHEAPRAYRRLRGVDDDDLAMAVLVMEMIEPETAGVLFTRDPVGDDSNVRLEMVAGTGEALVSGAVTPQAFTWPRDVATLAAGRLGPATGELVERGLALESAWGTALDIEFAIDRTNRLWLVQARPVTTLAATTPTTTADGGTTTLLTRAGIAEMLPGVLPPLLQTTAGRFVDEGFRHLLADLGADLGTAAEGSFVRFERSRALLDLGLLRRATATVPGGSVAALDRGYGAGPSAAGSASSRSSAAQVVRVLRRRRSAVVESEIIVQAADRLADDDGRRDDESVTELLARWERIQDLGARATAAEMAVAALATAAYEGVQHSLTRYVGSERARELAQQLTARPRGRSRPLDRCLRAVGADPGRAASDDQWREALARSGSRSVFGGPTWADDPDLALLSLTAAGPGDTPPAMVTDPLRSTERVPGSPRPHLSRVRTRFLRREAADSAELLDRRERTKRALLDLGGIAHRLTLGIGDRLAATGVLASPSDIWLLTPTELRTAVAAGAVPDDLPGRRSALAADRAFETAAIAPTSSGSGWPASPGRASGRAVVVTTPRAGAIERGDVLVAHTTDAGWAPLFALAGAIVVEEGGPLSHAAIVARELGVPAVVNLPGIVAQVRAAGPGATVEVDGSTGSVTLIEPAATVLPALAPVVGLPEDEPRLGVFVTGLIGASALFGVVVSITEAVSSARGIRRTRARAAIPATVLADVVRDGTAAARSAPTGLVSSRRYGRWALVIAVAGLLLGALGTGEYVAGESDARILWLLTALSSVLAAVAGAHLARVARVRWPDVPPTVRRLTPSPRPHTTARQRWQAMPTLHRRWLSVFGSTAVSLLLLNVFAPTTLQVIDERLYEAIGSPDPDPWGPDWFGMYFGRPQVVIPAALLIALFTVRCRVLAVAYPLTIMFGGILNLGLGALVGRARPPLGAHADQTDSFPSGHAIEVTLLLGLVPLAVAVLLRSRWFGSLVRLVASGVLAVMLIDGLREGSHWPTDHLGGFAIAMSAVVLVHALARVPSLHRGCTRCPAMALLPIAAEASGEDGIVDETGGGP
jgi:rifampicin phosphotransferase